MKSLFGWIHIGSLPNEQQRHQALLKLIRKIMATEAEIIAQLNEANEQLKAANTKIENTTVILVKVGTETDALKARITALEEQIAKGNVSPELVAAFEALKATATAQSDAITSLQSAATTVDDKVPDAPTP